MTGFLLFGRKYMEGHNLDSDEFQYIKDNLNIYELAELKLMGKLTLQENHTPLWREHRTLWLITKQKNARLWSRPKWAREPNWDGR